VPPTRDPHTPGYVISIDLPDGTNAPINEDDNFVLGPTHPPAPEMSVQPGVPQGEVIEFAMSSADSKFYPGIGREEGTFSRPDPSDPTKVIVSSGPKPYTRKVDVSVPKQYVPGTAAPFIVGAGGPDRLLFTALDNLIAQKRVPAMIAVSIGNGSGDAQGSQRGLEYDTMSSKYAEFVEAEVLPLVEQKCNVKLTKDPNARATIGAWELHAKLIPNSPRKPLRIWMEISDRDNLRTRDAYHDWVLAKEHMARVLAANGYPYQLVFVRNAGHTDRAVKLQTLPQALEHIWQGYPVR
jgi:iron(III)-enterobactin esterase